MSRTWPERLCVQAGLAFVCLGLAACSQTVRVPGHIVMQSAAPNPAAPNPAAQSRAASQLAQSAALNPVAPSAAQSTAATQTNTVATNTTATDSAPANPQSVAVSVTSAPASSAVTPVPPSSLAGFQTGAAEVVMEVEPASKQVREFIIKQADKKLLLPLEDARWQRGSIVLQLREHHGSLRLNWLDDSAPFDRITHESCTYSGYCEHDVEVEEDYCPDPFDDKSCYKKKVIKQEHGFYSACPGVQHVATTLQYSHAILSVELTDSNNLQMTFSGSSVSDLFELAKQPLGECKEP